MARIGQNFASTTRIDWLAQKSDPQGLTEQTYDANGDPENTVFEIDDIDSSHDNVPFTDGSGNISYDLASIINDHFRLRFCTAY